MALTLAVQQDAIVVPREAVQSGQRRGYVFVVRPDRTVEPRPVTVAREAGQEIVIAQGLTPGDQVVTEGQARLTRGAAGRTAGGIAGWDAAL